MLCEGKRLSGLAWRNDLYEVRIYGPAEVFHASTPISQNVFPISNTRSPGAVRIVEKSQAPKVRFSFLKLPCNPSTAFPTNVIPRYLGGSASRLKSETDADW